MDDKATKRGGGAVLAVVLVAVLVVLPMLYVLSAGPFVWMLSNGRIDSSWMPALDVAYTPLDWVANNVPVVGPAIQGYVRLWVPPQPQPVYAPPRAAAIPAPATTPAAPSGS